MGLLNLIATLGINTSPFQQGLDKAKLHASKFGSEVGSELKGKLGGAFAIAGIEEAIRRLVEWGGHVRDMADRTELSTAAVQELDFAAKQTGANFEEVANSLKKLAVAREAALSGDTEKMDAFTRLSISLNDLKTKTPEQLFIAIAQRIHDAGDSTQYLTALLDTMGKSADTLIPSMKQGIGELIGEFKKLNATVDEETINTLDNLGDNFDKLMVKIRGQSLNSTISKTIFEALNDEILAMTSGSVDLPTEAAAQEILTQLAGNILKEATTAPKKNSFDANQKEEKKDLDEKAKLQEKLYALNFAMMSDEQKRLEIQKRITASQNDYIKAKRGSKEELAAEVKLEESRKEMFDLDRGKIKAPNVRHIGSLRADSLASVGTFIGNAASVNAAQSDAIPRAQLHALERIDDKLGRKNTYFGNR